VTILDPGFFGKMRKSVGTRRRRVIDPNINLHGRRVVKATPPSTDQTHVIEPNVESESVDIDEIVEKDYIANDKLPSIQTEVLREKTEQWRKERIDATASIRKENKEKEVMEHRRKTGGVNENAKVDSKSLEVAEVPEILTVKSKFAEHKRKAAEPKDFTGKKSRVDEYPTKGEQDSDKKSWRNTISGWVKFAAPTVVAATAVIVAMKMLRKR